MSKAARERASGAPANGNSRHHHQIQQVMRDVFVLPHQRTK
jgi:hypothetical protein